MLPAFPRLKFIDFDARREPRTSRWCIMCQRDLKPSEDARTIRVLEIDGGPYSLHPDDEAAFDAGGSALDTERNWRDLGRCLIGSHCARTHGLEWSNP